MPNYFVQNEEDLNAIRPQVEELFAENMAMLNVCKITHGTQQCEQCTTVTQQQQHPNMHIIFISTHLEYNVMAMFLAFMNKYPLEWAEDVEDIESNSHIETIMMCPLSGTPFSLQQ